LEVTAVN